MKLKYYRKGDYLFPNLATESSGNLIGKYGMQRKSFLRAHKSGWYQSMLLTGKLDRHLAEVEKLAKERMDVLMAGLLQKYPVPNQEADPLAWAAHLNMLIEIAEECVREELIYTLSGIPLLPQLVRRKICYN